MVKLFKNMEKRDAFYSLIAIMLVVVQVYFDLKMPDYMAQITVLVQTEGSEFSEVLRNGAYMLGCAFGSMVGAIITGYLVSIVAARFSKIVGWKLFDKVTSFSTEEMDGFSTASLITRNTNDITQVQQMIAMGLQMLVKAPITAVWAVRKIFDKSWQWSAATGVGVLILLGVVSIIMIIVMPKFKLVQKLTDKLNATTRENLIGIRVIRAFNAEAYQTDKFEGVNTEITNLQIFIQQMFALMMPVIYLVMNGLSLAIYYIGAHLIDQAAMVDKIPLFGNVIVFSSYAMQVIMSFLMLAVVFMMLPRANVSIQRINEVLDTPFKITDGTVTGSDTMVRGKVEFKDVSFAYPGAEQPVLSDISFMTQPGETLAFIGSTGSGKSTLINLIPRFFDVTSGNVLVDDVDVRDYRLDDLHEKIGYVSQKAVLFNDSVAGNITFGSSAKPVTPEVIQQALQTAQALDFVEQMDEQEQTMLAQSGTNISGGQKQRLSIARAIARDPEIFIFDDSFSALDYKTDALLREALNQQTQDATKIIVAQRIGTIMNADQIIVLDEGRMVGCGTHQELLANCEVYQEIALSQLSKEELYHE